MRELPHLDVFVSKAAAEVIRMYKQDFELPGDVRIFKDTTASAAPVGAFYYGVYHTLILAPATSNTLRNAWRVFRITWPRTSLHKPANAACQRLCLRAIQRQRWTPKRRRAW